jgi:hypothetical protein
LSTLKIAAALVVVLVPSASFADETTWEYRVTPYVWAPTLIADLAIGIDPPTQSETDLLDILNFAFLVNGEVRKGDWGLIGEFNYLSLTDDLSTPGGRISSDANLDGFMVGAAGAYRFYADANASADLFAGVRAWWIDAEIEFQNRSNPSVTRNWVDPIVGARGQYQVTDRVSVSGLAEVGGFGIGSNIQWEVVGRAGYQFNDRFGVALGYRHLAIDFDDDKLVMQADISGPFLALDITW